jgi:hypothetical protein
MNKASDPIRMRTRVKTKSRSLADATYVSYVSNFAIGDHISHLQFGLGTVTEIDDAKLTIAFMVRGTKQILDNYVKHTK